MGIETVFMAHSLTYNNKNISFRLLEVLFAIKFYEYHSHALDFSSIQDNKITDVNTQDADLIIEMQQGDRKAFSTIYNKYWKRVYFFVSLYTKNPSDAEDLTQEIFIKVWESREKIAPDKDIANYLFIAAKNTALNHLRKNKNEPFFIENILDTLEEYASNYSDEHLAIKELEKEVESFIKQLPERQKEVFFLSRKGNYTYAQIAEKMNISIKTVENHMTRALTFLRKKMQL